MSVPAIFILSMVIAASGPGSGGSGPQPVCPISSFWCTNLSKPGTSGLTNGGIYNLIPGTNVTFQTNSSHQLVVNSSGGGSGLTNGFNSTQFDTNSAGAVEIKSGASFTNAILVTPNITGLTLTNAFTNSPVTAAGANVTVTSTTNAAGRITYTTASTGGSFVGLTNYTLQTTTNFTRPADANGTNWIGVVTNYLGRSMSGICEVSIPNIDGSGQMEDIYFPYNTDEVNGNIIIGTPVYSTFDAQYRIVGIRGNHSLSGPAGGMRIDILMAAGFAINAYTNITVVTSGRNAGIAIADTNAIAFGTTSATVVPDPTLGVNTSGRGSVGGDFKMNANLVGADDDSVIAGAITSGGHMGFTFLDKFNQGWHHDYFTTIDTFDFAISATSFIGNGSALTSLTGANVTGTVDQANVAGFASNAGGLTTGDQLTNAVFVRTDIYTVEVQPPFVWSGDGSLITNINDAGLSANVARLNATQKFTGVNTMTNAAGLIGGSWVGGVSNLLAPSAITFPATTVNWTNTTGRTVSVFIDNSGVTGSATKINGTQVYSSLVGDIFFILQPNETFSETYTIGTPSGKIKPL